MKTLTCRDHGGTFQIPAGRGRPPVRCGGKHPDCTRVKTVEIQGRKLQVDRTHYEPEATAERRKTARVEKLTPEQSMERAQADSAAIRGVELKPKNSSIAPAMAAKARLEPMGWLCKGSARGDRAELMATREGETIIMRWVNGLVNQQEYILWDEKPSANNKPASNLSFDPDECTDREIVMALHGSKVTWWNALGQREEKAVVARDKLTIEHLYNGLGDETAGDRIVKFADHNGEGFRAFRLSALLKVG